MLQKKHGISYYLKNIELKYRVPTHMVPILSLNRKVPRITTDISY